MSKEPKLPARIKKLILYMSNGRTLCCHITKSEVGNEYQYWLEPDGKPVGTWTVQRALEMGLIKSNGDGLFADSEPQTYVLA